MSIWFLQPSLDQLNRMSAGCMLETIGIEFTDIGPDYLEASMPVDDRTKQPLGLLHGGASVVLAETLGSMAATFCVDPQKYSCVGLSITANHLKAVRDGVVVGRAEPVHLGRTTQVWEIPIFAGDKLASVHRLTMAVISA